MMTMRSCASNQNNKALCHISFKSLTFLPVITNRQQAVLPDVIWMWK